MKITFKGEDKQGKTHWVTTELPGSIKFKDEQDLVVGVINAINTQLIKDGNEHDSWTRMHFDFLEIDLTVDGWETKLWNTYQAYTGAGMERG